MTLPEAFKERTLEFYITLCHRLMKQRQEVSEESDSILLLRACWNLAEMLFSLREKRRGGKMPDEELLGSAIQSCWELCDIFREGWTHIRPDRGTPRSSQTNFFNHAPAPSTAGEPTPRGVSKDYAAMSSAGSIRSSRSKREEKRSSRDGSSLHGRKPAAVVPETPVTEFEDTPLSPDTDTPAPNILVLGTSTAESNRGGRWSSSASQLSSYSQSSARTSSTATTATSAEDVNITRIKVLILKAAMNIGFTRDTDTVSQGKGKHAAISLQTFVKSLPTGSFGSLPAHAALLQSYKNLVLADSSFRTSATLPAKGKKATAGDIAKSVGYMILRAGQSGQYAFLRDLFKLVFGFHMEEVEGKKSFTITV